MQSQSTTTSPAAKADNRADKASAIRKVIRQNWRTHSDREMAKLANCSNRTIGDHRRKMAENGDILPRFDESTHTNETCLNEVCTFAIRPAPENDQLYDPVRVDDPKFLSLVADMKANGLINPVGVSRDGYIFDGHRRYEAARYLGWDRIKISIRWATSWNEDRDGFLRLLRSCNEHRVKTTTEVMRESLVTMEPDARQRIWNYRDTTSTIDGNEVFTLVGSMKRAEIKEKKSLRDALIRTVNHRYEKHGPTSDRKIFYLLLNQTGLLRNDVRKTLFLNDDKCYQDVTNMLTRLRLDGSIPFEAIVDETRPVVLWQTHRSVAPFVQKELADFLSNYHRDLQQSQPNHLEFLVEKNTMAADMRPIAAKYGLPMTSGRGYSSLPPRKAMVDRFRASGREKLIVVVVSDFDPDGQSIANSFGVSLRDDFGIPEKSLVIIKAALTHKQTQELDLHEGQIAKEDANGYQAFVDAYGKRCWELEAVPTKTLKEIVEATIRRILDLDAFNRELAKQKSEQAELNQHRRQVQQALSGLDLRGSEA